MPTLSEFVITFGLRRQEADGTMQTFFRFETTRQFQSFRYEVEVDAQLRADTHAIFFTIKGVRAPTGLMSSSGSAVTEFCWPVLEGDYTAHVTGAKQSGSFTFRGSSQGIELLDAGGEDFVQLRPVDEIEVVRS